MSEEISISPMEENDADFVLEIRNHETTLLYIHDQRSFTRNDFTEWYRMNKPEWYIVRKNNRPFGYFRTSNPNKKNHSICVGMDIHPGFRGKGLAKPAYAEFFKFLKSNGYENLSLEVLSHNFVARKLYEDLGFIETDRKLHHHTVDSIKMEMSI